ncbi:MAG: aminodeoxychorismate/anthranilate synthase component II [Chitinispirillaceae bacterium]|nr:aminodeoxychorismate/anthranilate synthase component II [Chitinispirillaceae bacterium]
MLLVIDNYDSFTYNLVQFLGEVSDMAIKVFRNDKITTREIAKLSPSHIVISPGPCTPKEAGISVDTVKEFYRCTPILGVCLGHQSLGFAFGAAIIRAPYLMHGKVSQIHHNGKHIFTGLPSPFTATRYHSLIIDRATCPACLEIISRTEDGIIMGVKHKKHPVYGVQFHPESILTEHGKELLKNFLEGR